MPVFRLELRAQHVRERPRRLLTGRFKRPLVGREDESLAIRQSLVRAHPQQRMRRCLVRGPTGSGVSRLVREVVAVLRGSRSNLTVAEADITGREGFRHDAGRVGARLELVAFGVLPRGVDVAERVDDGCGRGAFPGGGCPPRRR